MTQKAGALRCRWAAGPAEGARKTTYCARDTANNVKTRLRLCQRVVEFGWWRRLSWFASCEAGAIKQQSVVEFTQGRLREQPRHRSPTTQLIHARAAISIRTSYSPPSSPYRPIPPSHPPQASAKYPTAAPAPPAATNIPAAKSFVTLSPKHCLRNSSFASTITWSP